MDSIAPASTSLLGFDDNDLSLLAEVDTAFLLDNSSSMKITDRGSTLNRWEQVRVALRLIAPICALYDTNGLDVYILNRLINSHKNRYTNVATAEKVEEIFNSVIITGVTPTGRRLSEILEPYLHELETKMREAKRGTLSSKVCKPLNLIVITDGRADDQKYVREVIVKAARRLDDLKADDHQIGIQFFQVGRDKKATEDLTELDDDLKVMDGVRDMVDTVAIDLEEEQELDARTILKIVLGAVKRKLDLTAVKIQTKNRGSHGR